MDVDDINYAVDSIRSTFVDGSRLLDFASDVLDGWVCLSEMEPIYVRQRADGRWYSYKGNRRLFVLKKMQEHGFLDEPVPVCSFVGRKRFTARDDEPLWLRGYDFGADIDELLEAAYESSSSDWSSGSDATTSDGNDVGSEMSDTTTRDDDDDSYDWTQETYVCFNMFCNMYMYTKRGYRCPAIEVSLSFEVLDLLVYLCRHRYTYRHVCLPVHVTCWILFQCEFCAILFIDRFETFDLRPSLINFGQDSIKYEFTDGQTLQTLFLDLFTGRKDVVDFPPLEVKNISGSWFCMEGNRRLFIFKKLNQYSYLPTVRVKLYHGNGRVTAQPGRQIKIRSRPEVEAEMNGWLQAIHQWLLPSWLNPGQYRSGF